MQDLNKKAFEVSVLEHNDKYLHLPSFIGRSKKASLITSSSEFRKKTPRLGRQVTITSGERDFNKVSGSSPCHIHYVVL